jgi:phage gpG-like protein
MKIEIKADLAEIVNSFEERKKYVKTNLYNSFRRIAYALAAYIKTQKLSGQVLQRISGKLAGSVGYRVTQSGGDFNLEVYAGGDEAPYAIVHELGGTIQIPTHLSASRLGRQFTVQAHSAKYPQRSFMKTSLEENEDAIAQKIQEAVQAAINLQEIS